MATSAKHGIAKYNAGCRCDVCKKATSEYHKARRRKLAESVGDPDVPLGAGLRLLNGLADNAPTCENPVSAPSNSVVSAVMEEIQSLSGHKRPALAASAVALAEVLDNPKATATKPAAAAKLAVLLEQLRKSTDGKKSKLTAIRSMTSANTAAG